ncbi:GNAT family N-acetyltransferase [Shouchella miscanthi]|uniref:GNAT family N-acetyltransferase n=1 Tax=Shouchella miscanthi TaxID=2598861 RepID=A0ABU6NHL7_9BACI|nr:GNAT family N-acetyltransferase [Shouchella miscanthi]MED4127698.1 GNAT family N-acetyltransferase [Shouchella miscanthi]
MVIKTLDARHFDEAFALSCYAFQATPTDEQTEAARTTWSHHNATHFALMDENQLTSKLTLLSLSIQLYGRTVPMGGIASVASYPEARRQGGVRKLLHHSLETMKENGQLLSYLAPFSVSFYRKFGWEIVFDEVHYNVEKNQLPRPLATLEGTLTRVPYQDNRIKDVYKKCLCHGMLERDEVWWERKQEENKEYHTVLYEDAEGTPKAYMVYRFSESKWTTKEMIYHDGSALKALLHFIGQHDSMLNEATITVPGSSALHYFLPDPLTKATTKPYFMARIVDFQAFIETLPFLADGQFTIRIQDDFATWNDTTFALTIEAGHARCIPTTEPPSMYMTIQTASSLLMGYKRPTFYKQADLVTGSEEAIDRFFRTLPDQEPALHDFF